METMLFLGWVALLMATASNASLRGELPPLTLEVVGPGSSPANPALGMTVTLRVVSRKVQELPPWVSIQRADVPSTPLFSRPIWGPISFRYGEKADNLPIPIYASGWSAEYNASRVSQNSSAVTVYSSFANAEVPAALGVAFTGPGSCEISLQRANTTAHALPLLFDSVLFNRFVGSNLAANPPQFVSSYFYRQVSETGSIRLTFQQPGIYYYGAVSSYQSRQGLCTAGGLRDGRPSTHPTALVVVGPNGETGNASLPTGFAGAVYTLPALRTQHQFCLIHRNVTAFSGGLMQVSLCRSNAGQEIPNQRPS